MTTHAGDGDGLMTPARRRVTLAQLLVSVAVLALPLALFAPALRGGWNPWFGALALVAFGVELLALVWFVLAPAARRGAARGRGGGSEGEQRDRLFLTLGPCVAVAAPLAGWGAGYRLRVWPLLEMGCLLLLPVGALLAAGGLAFGLVDLVRRPRDARHVALRTLVLVLALPCVLSFALAADAGQRRMRDGVDARKLGRDCVRLLKATAGQEPRPLTAAAERFPELRRLHPSYVTGDERRLRIELHGGFDHYGYELAQDFNAGTWTLSWYTEGSSRPLLEWPFETEP